MGQKTDTGGYAFPTDVETMFKGEYAHTPGMSVRTWLVGHILAGSYSRPMVPATKKERRECARAAIEQAEITIEELRK